MSILSDNYSSYIKSIFLSFLLIYAFVPFETNNIYLSYIIKQVGISSIILYALYINKFKIRFSISYIATITTIIFIIFGFLSLFVSLQPESFIFFYFALFFGLFISNQIFYNPVFKNIFLFSLKILLWLSIIIFFIQFSFFTFTNNVIDFHNIVFPFSEARIGIQKNFNGLHRMGGFYIEPGTYSNYMFLFLSMYLILSKNKTSPLLFLGAISIILSFSVWGMIFGSFFLFFLLFINLSNSSWKKKSLFISILFTISYLTINFFIESNAVKFASSKIEGDNVSTSSKKEVYTKYRDNFLSFLVIGEGFKPKSLVGIQSPQDAGFLINLSIVFGILPTLIFLLIYIKTFLKYSSIGELILTAPIFISKIYFFDPAFWLFIFLIIYGSKIRKDQDNFIYKNNNITNNLYFNKGNT